MVHVLLDLDQQFPVAVVPIGILELDEPVA